MHAAPHDPGGDQRARPGRVRGRARPPLRGLAVDRRRDLARAPVRRRDRAARRAVPDDARGAGRAAGRADPGAPRPGGPGGARRDAHLGVDQGAGVGGAGPPLAG